MRPCAPVRLPVCVLLQYCFYAVHWAACLLYKVGVLQGGINGTNWLARTHGDAPTYFDAEDGAFGR